MRANKGVMWVKLENRLTLLTHTLQNECLWCQNSTQRKKVHFVRIYDIMKKIEYFCCDKSNILMNRLWARGYTFAQDQPSSRVRFKQGLNPFDDVSYLLSSEVLGMICFNLLLLFFW